LVAAFASGRVPRARAADAPDWMHAAAAAPLPKVPDDASSVVLLDDETISVQANGDIINHDRVAIKILLSSGRDKGTLRLRYGLEESKILMIKSWCIPAAGKELATTDKDVTDQDIFSNDIDTVDRMKELKAPAPDPGNIVGFEFEVRVRPELPQQPWDFQDLKFTHLARFTLQLPPGWKYSVRWINHADVPAQQDGPNQWHWEVHDVPAIDDTEKNAPSRDALAGRAIFNLFQTDPALHDKIFDSWKEFGLWYDRLTADRRDDSPEIESKVQELTASAATPLDKVRAITAWMHSQIRYYAVEFGINGFQPLPASLVFAHRYGDNKDQATLLSSMLKDIGIDSYYVIAQTHRGIVGPGDPPWNGFDDVILAIRLPPDVPVSGLYATYRHPQLGTLLFFDTTSEVVPLGYLPSYLQATYGLLVTDQGGELLELPLLPPPTNRLLRQARFSLDSTGELQGTVKEVRWGNPAATLRSQIRKATAQDSRADVLETFLAQFVPGADLTQASAENLDDNAANLELNYQFVAQNYAQSSGDLLLVRPRVLGRDGDPLLEDTSKRRQYPVDLGSTELASDIFEIALPAGYVVADLPAPVKADYPFASYSSKVECDGKVLRYTRTLQVKSVVVPTEQLADLKKFYEQIAEDENSSAVLKHADSN
jgi:hypothetical protein